MECFAYLNLNIINIISVINLINIIKFSISMNIIINLIIN